MNDDDDLAALDDPGIGHRHDAAAASTTGAVSPTGDGRVDEALEGLRDLDDADVARHAAGYDEIHRSLAAVLDDAASLEQTEQ